MRYTEAKKLGIAQITVHDDKPDFICVEYSEHDRYTGELTVVEHGKHRLEDLPVRIAQMKESIEDLEAMIADGTPVMDEYLAAKAAEQAEDEPLNSDERAEA